MVRPARKLFTVDEYDRMVGAGVFGEDDRIELIEGEIVEMSPIGSPHSGTVNCLTALFTSGLGARAVVSVQNPVRMPPRSEPEPDVVLLRPRTDFYRDSHPEPSDVLLIVEVAQSSAGFDRGEKMQLYARHGIREYWLVDPDSKRVEVYREPNPNGYGSRKILGGGASLAPEAFPDLIFKVEDVLGS